MSEEKHYQQGNEILIKSIGNESDAEASQPSAVDTREPGRTGATVFGTSSNKALFEDKSKGPTSLKYPSDAYVGIEPSYDLEPDESSREPLNVHFCGLLNPNVLLQPYWTCISRRRFGGRCKVLISKENTQAAVHEIKRLWADVPKNVPSETELAELSKLLLCKRFHHFEASKIAIAWRKELSSSSCLNALMIDKDIRSINKSEKFIQFPRRKPDSIISALANAMRKPPSPIDFRDGFIYLFSRPGTPSVIKIGTTSVNVPRRLGHTAARCGFLPNLISQHFVRYGLRTEKLVFTSLRKQRRRELTCNAGKGCRLSHFDWFEIDDHLALLTIQRWTAWMNLNPYHADRLDVFWEIKLFEAEQLPNLDAFHQWIENMTQICIQKGEDSWRGRTDGRFESVNELQLSPISPPLSVVSADVPSLVSGTTLSSTMSDDGLKSPVEEFVAWLLKDEVIQPLQGVAIERIGAERFERNFCRLLQRYSKDLQTEAQTPSEIEAVRFVSRRRRNVGNCLRSHMEPSRKQASQAFETLLTQEPDRDEIIERFFGPAKTQLEIGMFNIDSSDFESTVINSTLKNHSVDDVSPEYNELDELDDIERDDSEHSEADKISASHLELVKEFMITSKAFGELRKNLRDFVFPPGQYILGDLADTETPRSVNISPAEGRTTLLSPELVKIDVNTISAATDVLDTNLISVSEKQNSVKVGNDAGIEENRIFNGISSSITASTPISGPHMVDLSVTDVLEDGEENKLNRTPFWKNEELIRFSALKRWMKVRWWQALRPRVKQGYRRIEWTCGCGQNLYGDFDNSDPQAVNQLAADLQRSNSNESPYSGIQSSNEGGLGDAPQNISTLTQSASSGKNLPAANSIDDQQPPATSIASELPISDPQYLALCVNTGGQKTLAEVEVSGVVSDAELFDRLKSNYHALRGFRDRYYFLIQPVTIRFVEFALFSRRNGYVGICDSNELCSIPPADHRQYSYDPVPLKPPPIPSEIFIHLLKCKNPEDVEKVWIHRIPKRLKQRLVDVPDRLVFGWGIHIIEGPNKSAVFWITMSTVFAGILASVLWTSLNDDIQGGMGLGSMIIALPPVIMAAFLFKLSAE